MKYKVGDKVRIKSLDWYNANKDCLGSVVTSIDNFTRHMSVYCGKVFTIASAKANFGYTLQEDGEYWTWTDEMFDETFNNNKDMEQKFKCKDEVIYRYSDSGIWRYGIYSHFDDNCHILVGDTVLEDGRREILPYEGNAHLVGTKDSPEEEIKLEEGDMVVCADCLNFLNYSTGSICQYIGIHRHSNKYSIKVKFAKDTNTFYKYCIPFSKFNPNDLEATKKEILTVENGKLVKVYK